VIANQQAALFYLNTDDLIALRQLLLRGAVVSEISYPFYMEKSEIRVADPDGQVL
jgi:hypothetical protein